MTERKMATIRQIKELLPITQADKIEIVKIDGWQVVVEKGLHQVGDYVLYCEIDSWIPHELAPFLSKGKEPREYNGIKGEKLKSIRLRNTLSQGLVLPIKDIIEENFNTIIQDWYKSKEGQIITANVRMPDNNFIIELFYEEFDLSKSLGIQKWEAPIPANMAGKMKGNFPSWIRKTDQERVQNIWSLLKDKYNEEEFFVELKLDGTSFTAYYNEGKFGVCSRNLELLLDDNNIYCKIALQYRLEEKLSSYGKNIAIQGEIIGEGIKGNPENIKGQQLHIFDIYNIDKGRYLTFEERCLAFNELDEDGNIGSIPVVDEILNGQILHFDDNADYEYHYKAVRLSDFNTIEDILKFADGHSLNSQCREGLVFKSKELINGDVFSFKLISNEFLIKQK